MLAALLDQLEGLTRNGPVLFVFEDAHWADATSLELLDLCLDRMRHLPVLMIITFRPEFDPVWAGLPHVSEFSLRRLDRGHVESMAQQVTGGRSLPTEVMDQIISKTDGVPLFVEELTKTVLESGILIEEGEGYRLDGPLPPLAIPSTLHDSLTARLDHLAPVKEIAQVGAAIGREFSYALLSSVITRGEASLRDGLAQLEQAQLVQREGEPPEATYTFKHALGRGLREFAEEPAPDPAPAHRGSVARAVPHGSRERAGNRRAAFHVGWTHGSGRRLLAEGGGPISRDRCEYRGDFSPKQRAGAAGKARSLARAGRP